MEILQTAAPFELAKGDPFLVPMYPVYLRGPAYLLAHQGKEAVGEFRNMIDHRGIVVNFPLNALARLGLARAYALWGDTAKARAAYQDLTAGMRRLRTFTRTRPQIRNEKRQKHWRERFLANLFVMFVKIRTTRARK